MKIKPKTYGPIFARSDDTGELRYGLEAARIDALRPPAGTPAEILLSAVAGCMVLSIHIAAKQKNLVPGPFFLDVSATKADSLPSRFGRYDIRINGDFAGDPDLARSITKTAKSICSVGNSLNGEFILHFSD